MLQVSLSAVSRWINDDQLQAFKTPGGHRRVAESDLIAFIRKQRFPVPPELKARMDAEAA